MSQLMVVRGQVSLEILIIAVIALLFSIGILSYYTQISDSTMALYLLDVHTIKAIDSADEVFVKERIDYRADPATSTLTLCLFTRNENGNALLSPADTASIETLIQARTKFSNVTLLENPSSPGPCS